VQQLAMQRAEAAEPLALHQNIEKNYHPQISPFKVIDTNECHVIPTRLTSAAGIFFKGASRMERVLGS
jgi:hypothetical protein